jgi:hypothetical protein
MSKKPANLPNIILVSQDHTNGLFHNVSDQDIIVDVLLEHISMAAFFDESIPEENNIEVREKYVGDFAMWKIVCKPNLQFNKQEALLSHEELFEFVIQGRKSLQLIQPHQYSFTTIDKMSEDMIHLRDKFKEALKGYIEQIINDSF